jgi:hypothetical protein
VQLLLYWRDLATPVARAEFLRRTSLGILLIGVTVAGMLARYGWASSGRRSSPACSRRESLRYRDSRHGLSPH